MTRTTIMLPHELKTRAAEHAHRMGLSLGELIRRSLDAALSPHGPHDAHDPMLADDAVFADDGPVDASVTHDRDLYGDES